MRTGAMYYMTNIQVPGKKPADITLTDKVVSLLQEYEKRYGKAPQVIEVSVTQVEDVKLPKGLKLVMRSVRLPVNHVLIGVDEE